MEKLFQRRKIFFLLSLLLFWPGKLVINNPVCPNQESRVIVLAKSHKLFLCEDSKVVKTNLSAPRKSGQFGIFIPVGYPNIQERNLGYTGGSIGIHGPIRWARFLGSLVNWFDTTKGCIGIASDKEMKEISDWMIKTKTSVVEIKL